LSGGKVNDKEAIEAIARICCPYEFDVLVEGSYYWNEAKRVIAELRRLGWKSPAEIAQMSAGTVSDGVSLEVCRAKERPRRQKKAKGYQIAKGTEI
jgi:hypothetical protein